MIIGSAAGCNSACLGVTNLKIAYPTNIYYSTAEGSDIQRNPKGWGAAYAVLYVLTAPLAAVAQIGGTIVEKKFYRVKELVELLGVSKSMVYEYVYANKIPAKRLGRRILIPEQFVRELLMTGK